MTPTPIPTSWDGRRETIPPDPSPEFVQVEYAVDASKVWTGRPRVFARVELDDRDRALVAAGAVLWLEMDGGELPWQIHLTDPDAGVPA